MKVVILGATGLVGREMIKVLEERHFPVTRLIPVASEKSIGCEISFRGTPVKVIGVEEALKEKAAVALFSAGSEPSLRYARAFASLKTTVIDNSSAWRKDTQIPLVVPEVNGHVLNGHQYIISNPNCSTIQMVMVLNPLHKRFEIERVVVSTYQSVTGTGYKALHQLENERKGFEGAMAYPHPIDMNLIPHGGYFMENGYTSEEEKLVHETQKIMEAPYIRVTATVVRVPLTGGHSEAANIAFKKPFQLDEIREILQATAGVVVVDDPCSNQYPMPLYARGKDEVFVGRIRRDETLPHALNLFIVADNLRKGAATNAVQIAEYLHQRNLLHNLND